MRKHRKKGPPGKRVSGYRTGLRTVALCEAAKGVVVIAAGLGLLALVHHNVQKVAEEVVRHLHFHPASHVPRIFLEAAAQLTDSRLWMLAVASLIYSAVRFIEAYGLWRSQVWAEWFGILSGGIYLPVEIYELTVNVTLVRLTLFLVNLFVVAWLAWGRWQGR